MHKYLKRVDGNINSESVYRQFGQSDVYDNSIVIHNRIRAPGSRARGKGNARDGKGTRGEGQRDANRAEGIETMGEAVIIIPKMRLEMRG